MLLLVAGTVFGSSMAAIAAPYLFAAIIDQAGSGWPEKLTFGLAGYAALVGLAFGLQYMVQYLSLLSAQSLGFIASTSFFERLTRKRIGFFLDHNPAEIQKAQMQGAQSLSILVQLGLIVFIPGATQIVLALALLGAKIDLQVAGIVVAYGSLFVAVTYAANRWTKPDLEKAMEAGQENARFVGNAVGSMETLRHFGGEEWMTERFNRTAREVFEGWRRFSLKRVALASFYAAALGVQVAITLRLLLPRVQAGDLSIGDLVLFNTLLMQLNWPFEMIGHAIDDVMRAYTGFVPFARLWAEPEEPRGSGSTRKILLDSGRISFEDVAFEYGNGRGTAGVTFTAGRGRLTFITGETGSGKSTLFKMALKSLEPTRGRILVDDTDLATIDRRDWYRLIGVVPQEIMLLNDTLEANIVLGRKPDTDKLRAATARASILERIEAMPDGFRTVVGERGLKLSGGERQRIALARALYDQPRFLFLDEASSALDEATEAGIMENIRALASEMTVIAITHRTGMIAPGDNVARLAAPAPALAQGERLPA
ncbi:ABC transporter ATP-binding protein [Rhizobium sp. ACO-34A]|nr:ABC transporter ATP-binding protein [Rhizobium sp. ACO-34A]